ncbi:LysR family transcriptional regulator [Thioalkalivibrio sp. ALR17-21]|uniref:LysR family transcriptional regulator n=1 Tax=Thioalkalivibrio sp. ALR17-21 TaxID=1269813 RepID=UPI000462DAC8|nr:LysR family transcriptional regulator [Thioalkalivibrio sp. ALR17-21]
MLEIRHLRALHEIVRLGSVTAAAESLCVTQSALSHQLRQLEERMDVVLFERRSTPVRLSPAGTRLLQAAERVLPEVAAAERDIARIRDGRGGRLYLALECHSCFQWLMPSLAAFREHWPEVELDLSLSHGFDALNALREREVDAAVSPDPVEDPELIALDLLEYENLLIVPRGHRLEGASYVEPADLEGETLITYPVEEERLDICRHFLHPAGISLPRRTTEVTAMLLQLVASGRGVASLPEWALPELEAQMQGAGNGARGSGRSAIARLRMGPDGLWSTLRLAIRREDEGLAFMQDFVGIARDELHQASVRRG